MSKGTGVGTANLAVGQPHRYLEDSDGSTVHLYKSSSTWARRIFFDPPVRNGAAVIHPDAPDCEVALSEPDGDNTCQGSQISDPTATKNVAPEAGECSVSYDRRRLRGDHPAACACFDCDERRKWRLPQTSRTRQAPTAPPAKPPAAREDVTRQTPPSPPFPSSLPTTGPGQRSGTIRPGGYIPIPPTTPPKPKPR